MIEKTQAQIIGALVQMCEAYHTLSGSPYDPKTSDSYVQSKLLKTAILSLKAKVQDLAEIPQNLQLAMIQTCDRDICLGLRIGPSAPKVSIPLERQEILARQDPLRFIFMAERGLAPGATETETRISDVLAKIVLECADHDTEEFVSALSCWCHNVVNYKMLLAIAATPGFIDTPSMATIMARLIRANLFWYEQTYGEVQVSSVGTLGPFAAMAIALTNVGMAWVGAPSEPIKEVVDAAQSPHQRLSMMKTYVSLERFLLEHDASTFFRMPLTGASGQGDLKNYRNVTSIKWGPHFNPEDSAHHIRASSSQDAARGLAGGNSLSTLKTLQIHDGTCWRPVYDVPHADGGMLNPPPSA